MNLNKMKKIIIIIKIINNKIYNIFLNNFIKFLIIENIYFYFFVQNFKKMIKVKIKNKVLIMLTLIFFKFVFF